ncbi:MFS transporter [Streptomyces sp. ME19-01-6]|uniref:MFS transporter n=1 Tax=Streptomyces sp. ME19-01-6 TaxID=3028686 RepID=UPI0029BAEE10|nr:MFS transporter [Streptomyces sp. ME19-01-6]MDX3227859.1 MFS transporter [Streptomyces sp. ME19-01-6]
MRHAYWWHFALIYLSGVMAATSIGRITPVSIDLENDLGLSLGQVGLVASSVTAVAAVLGLAVSVALRPLDPRRTLIGGLVVMGLAGLLVSRAGGFPLLLGGRLVESVGYVVVVIAAPVLILGLGDDERRTVALAIWGTFMPVGLALGAFGGGLLSGGFGWRTSLAVAAAVTLAMAAAALRLPGAGAREAGPEAEGPAGRATVTESHDGAKDRDGTGDRWARARRLARPVALGAGFATISATIVTFVALYPTYLHDEFDIPTAAAGTLTGSVSFAGVAGGFAASVLLRRGVRMKYLFTAALLMPAGAFAAFGSTGGLGISMTSAVLIAVTNELVVATVFAALPLVVRTSADVGVANGVVAQLGSVGSLAGPPLVGLVVTAADGWWAVGPTLLVGCAVGVVLLRAAVGTGQQV